VLGLPHAPNNEDSVMGTNIPPVPKYFDYHLEEFEIRRVQDSHGMYKVILRIVKDNSLFGSVLCKRSLVYPSTQVALTENQLN